MQDYCACGLSAVARCPVDATTVCKKHTGPYPANLLHNVGMMEYQANGGGNQIYEAGLLGTADLMRPDGSKLSIDLTAARQLKICSACVDTAVEQLCNRFAAALLSYTRGSRERALIELARRTRGSWENLNNAAGLGEYGTSVHGDAVISAMGRPYPNWLMPNAQGTLAAAYAQIARARGLNPAPINCFDALGHSPSREIEKKYKSIRRSSAPVWQFMYMNIDGRRVRAFVRQDGDLRPDEGGRFDTPADFLQWACDPVPVTAARLSENERRHPRPSVPDLVDTLAKALSELLPDSR